MDYKDKTTKEEQISYKLVGEDGTELGIYTIGKVDVDAQRRKDGTKSRRIPARPPGRFLFGDFGDDED